MKVIQVTDKLEDHEAKVAFQSQKGDIDMGEFRVGRSGIYTLGVSSCIVVAAHNFGSKVGMMGHFTALGEDDIGRDESRKSFGKALESIKTLGSKASTSVWLGGGAPFYSPKGGEDQVQSDREFAQAYTKDFCHDLGLRPTALTVDWTPADRTIDAGMACYVGKLFICQYQAVDPPVRAQMYES